MKSFEKYLKSHIGLFKIHMNNGMNYILLLQVKTNIFPRRWWIANCEPRFENICNRKILTRV